MAMNWATFKTRTITAIVFVAVMLCGLLINKISFTVLVGIIFIGCWVEWYRLTEKINDFPYWLRYLGSIAYVIVPLFLLLDLRLNNFDFENDSLAQKHLPLLLFFSIWLNDTMAYIVGSFIGKTPFSKYSPKKTWEGTIGGILLAATIMYFLAPRLLECSPTQAGVIGIVAAITGTVGDLFESYLKRRAGVKDSGSFMPGHGGFLDRFDSLLFAAPFVWLAVHFIL
jgi:phosphatidate cytidylyltransferase